jgi:acyl-CoA thioesterase
MDDPTSEPPPEYGDFPLRRFLGMELTGDEAGIGIARVDVGPDHLNPNGVVHGAVLFALVDTAMGKATMSVVDEPGRYCASIEVSLRFIRPAVAGALTATATVVKRGRSVVHLEARVLGDDDRLVGTATGTFALLGG